MEKINCKLNKIIRSKKINLKKLSNETGINILILFFTLKIRILKPTLIRTLEICRSIDISISSLL